jgi:uncharacterized protein
MDNFKLTLSILPEILAVCSLKNNEPIPAWGIKSSFFSVSRTIDELSIVCPESNIPDNIKSEKNLRAIKIEGKLEFKQTGILASLATPLAEAGISIYVVSTFNTDYILIKDKSLRKAIDLLGKFCDIVK